MVANTFNTLAVLLIGLAPALAQTAPPKFIVGTVAGFQAESAEIQVKPDTGDTVSLKVTTGTQALRVPPGEKDLKKAEPIKITDVASGDRVLVNLMPNAFEARRIVVMSSSDIARRNEADRLDWSKRGVAGIVAAKTGSEITLTKRSMQGEVKLTVNVSESTAYRRYAPDSVKFADAKNSSLAEISVGDQLRARGQKSEDGLKVAADEVVFGTFVTKAGPITAVNVEAKEITVKDLATSKTLVIKLTEDSQLKKLPDFAAMFAGGAPGAGAPGGGGPGGGGPGGGMPGRGTPGAGGPPAGMRPPGGMPGGGPPDLSQMLERMPPAKLEDLKPGESIVVSSTKGASADRITAIMLVANADMLIRMASMQSGAGARPSGAGGGMGMGPSMGMGGMGGGFGGFNMPGMIP
jgi:hypothetical protein